MKIRMTALEADELLASIQINLEEVALGSVLLIDDKTTGRMRYDIGSIIRECVLKSEDARLAAGRKGKADGK